VGGLRYLARVMLMFLPIKHLIFYSMERRLLIWCFDSRFDLQPRFDLTHQHCFSGSFILNVLLNHYPLMLLDQLLFEHIFYA